MDNRSGINFVKDYQPGLDAVDGNPFADLTVLGKIVDALFMDGRLIINNCGLEVLKPN